MHGEFGIDIPNFTQVVNDAYNRALNKAIVKFHPAVKRAPKKAQQTALAALMARGLSPFHGEMGIVYGDSDPFAYAPFAPFAPFDPAPNFGIEYGDMSMSRGDLDPFRHDIRFGADAVIPGTIVTPGLTEANAQAGTDWTSPLVADPRFDAYEDEGGFAQAAALFPGDLDPLEFEIYPGHTGDEWDYNTTPNNPPMLIIAGEDDVAGEFDADACHQMKLRG